MWQVPISVHFDHGTTKHELLEALELVSFELYIAYVHSISTIALVLCKNFIPINTCRDLIR